MFDSELLPPSHLTTIVDHRWASANCKMVKIPDGAVESFFQQPRCGLNSRWYSVYLVYYKLRDPCGVSTINSIFS
jgi:hypothetical protein